MKIKSIILAAAIIIILGSMTFWSYWTFSAPDKTCLSCHEIGIAYDNWAQSAHRDIDCKNCHGGALSSGLHSLRENARRVFQHYSEDYHDDIGLSEQQVVDIMQECRGCHQREYANWQASGHSMTYEAVYLNEEHNTTERLNNDCLRCHGIFYEGAVNDIVTPINMEGPWELVNPESADRPTIPCLTCHRIHAQGVPATAPNYAHPENISYQRNRVVRVGFYDRREKMFIPADILPVLELSNEEIIVTSDEVQRVCTQCHAPIVHHIAGTSDDKTPRGVHEGLACSSCHAAHSNETAQSCSNCHPSLSNCGLDVKTMNTTFKTANSAHDIHFMECTDCHTDGIPG
jgi:hypothetical protein